MAAMVAGWFNEGQIQRILKCLVTEPIRGYVMQLDGKYCAAWTIARAIF